MHVKYIGAHADGVEIAEVGDKYVAHGETVEVSDDLGERLCEQIGEWVEVPAPQPPKNDAGNAASKSKPAKAEQEGS